MSKLKKTFIALFWGKGLVAIRQIISVPLLIKFWGIEYYGHWLVLTSIPSFLAMSNLGLGSSATVNIAMNIANGDESSAAKTLCTTWVILGAISLIVLSLLYLALQIFATNNPLPRSNDILLMMVAYLLLRMFMVPLSGWWNGQGIASQSVNQWNIAVFVETCIMMFTPMLGGKAEHMAAATLICFSIWTVGYLWNTHAKGCRLWQKGDFKYDRKNAKSLLGIGIGHQLSPLWQAIYFQGSTLLCSHLFGPVGTATWGAIRVFVRSGNQILELINQSLSTEFQRLFGQNKIEEIRNLYGLGLCASLCVSLILSIGIIFPGKWVFGWWTHHKLDVDWLTWIIMALSILPFSLWQLSAEVQRSANKPWYQNSLGVVFSLLTLLVTFQLAKLGLSAFSIGTITFEILMAITLIPKTNNFLNCKFSTLILQSSSRFISMIESALSKFTFKPSR